MPFQIKPRMAILLVLLCLAAINFFRPVIFFELPTPNRTQDILKTLTTRAESGDPEAQYQLALRHQNGRGLEKDEKAAFALYEKAANQGHAKAQNNLGVIYENGKIVQIDLDKAATLYKSALDGGLELSRDNLLNILLLKKDYAAAIALYKTAAESGDQSAQEILAYIFMRQDDFTNAAYWFSKLSDTSSVYINKNMGYLYRYGKGLPRSLTRAKEFFEKAATEGDAYSQYSLAEIYLEEKNYEQAIPWLHKAMEQNHAKAFGSLGYLYIEGTGVEKNLLKAGHLYRQAANLDKEYMVKHLLDIDSICRKPDNYNYRKIESCLVSAGAGSAEARKLLAIYYYFGTGVKKDDIEALAWGLLTPGEVPEGEKDPTTIRAFAIMSKLFLTLDKASIEIAKEKAIQYKKEYSDPSP